MSGEVKTADLASPLQAVRGDGSSAQEADTHRAEDGTVLADLIAALKGLKAAFGDPMTRRALGGHNERQQVAILAASAAITKAEGGSQ